MIEVALVVVTGIVAGVAIVALVRARSKKVETLTGVVAPEFKCKCPNCGTQVPADSAFCVHCGSTF